MQLKKYFQTIQCSSRNKYFKTYIYLAVIRVCLVFLPQLGYIHPDEFFQSIEVIVGEEFQLEHTKAWEFNGTLPIRSMVIPYFLYKIPMDLLKLLAMYVRYFAGIDICTPYAIFVYPRLIMCLVSFINDWSLFKICQLFGLRSDVRLLALSSSFVIITFGTRTFSNSIEMALCSLFLYVVSDCMVHTNTVIFQREFLEQKYEQAETVVDKVKAFKKLAALPSHTVYKSSIVAPLFVAGCFNRPTFLIFGMPMMFFWMQRGLGTKTVTFVDFNLRFFALLFCGLPIVMLFILIDSFYYQFITLSEIGYVQIGIDNFVVTPLNFIRYNIDPSNTADHGVHAKYLHLLVNMPMLFNVLGIVAIASFVHMIYRFMRAEYKYLPRAQSIATLMNAAIFVPVGILSLSNHQEPRFIIPITLPIILLHAPKFMTGFAIPNPFGSSRCGQFIYDQFLCRKKSADRILKCWYAINIALTLFFGFIHQGGVIQLSQYLSENVVNYRTQQRADLNSNVYLATSHLYNIPTSLLFIPSTKTLLTNPDNGQKYTRKKQFFLYEYGSLPLNELQHKLKLILDVNEMRLHRDKKNYKLYLAIPSSLTEELSIALFNSNHTMIKYQRVKMFYPHLSTEALPNLFLKHFTEIRTDVFNLDQTCSFFENRKEIEPYSIEAALRQLSSFVHQFGLVLYRVEVRRKNTFSE